VPAILYAWALTVLHPNVVVFIHDMKDGESKDPPVRLATRIYRSPPDGVAGFLATWEIRQFGSPEVQDLPAEMGIPRGTTTLVGMLEGRDRPGRRSNFPEIASMVRESLSLSLSEVRRKRKGRQLSLRKSKKELRLEDLRQRLSDRAVGGTVKRRLDKIYGVALDEYRAFYLLRTAWEREFYRNSPRTPQDRAAVEWRAAVADPTEHILRELAGRDPSLAIGSNRLLTEPASWAELRDDTREAIGGRFAGPEIAVSHEKDNPGNTIRFTIVLLEKRPSAPETA
jgi:hypothetical protein